MVKKHMKPNQTNAKGGIVEEEAAFDVSNVMYVSRRKSYKNRFQN